MDKEYAKELFYKASDNSIFYLDSTEVVSLDSIDIILNAIYDDFEKEKLTFGDYTFTSCDDCKNKIDGIFQEVCNNCKRFYGCYFEKKEM